MFENNINAVAYTQNYVCVHTQAHTETHTQGKPTVPLEQRMTEHLETSSPGLASALYPQLTLSLYSWI